MKKLWIIFFIFLSVFYSSILAGDILLTDEQAAKLKVEKRLAGDKKTADELTITTDELRDGIEKSEELAERIRANESGTDKRIAEAEKAIGRAKEKSRNTVELADECLAILQEAKKTEE